ncbi:DUF2933 domain-containing protein [Metapseudomonas furukawaii]|jgi:hypothetical protein|uniref:DUF2933 domain-containing protein n=1 Tax=Metapseudomonas furukawaii TaxID=1149133 RepID=UPI000BBA77D3|nr:DUF2933 domain-containing protein [Pseudomonas furukawaii]
MNILTGKVRPASAKSGYLICPALGIGLTRPTTTATKSSDRSGGGEFQQPASVAPTLLALLCPLMMLVCMRGMHKKATGTAPQTVKSIKQLPVDAR